MDAAESALIETYVESLQRCLERPKFLPRFYELFLASSDEVRRKFEHTDFPRQLRAIKKSLLEAGWIHNPGEEAKAELARIAKSHSRAEKDIPPGLYDLWLDSLIQAVKETDPRFTPNIEGAWRGVLGRVIAFMKAQY